MKYMVRVFAFLILCVFLISSALASGFSQNGDAIEKAADSVLQIAGLHADDPDVISTGSGFVAFNNQTLITNYHVIEGLMGLYAWDDNDKDYDKEYAIKYILCADKKADIAILEFESPTNLQPLELYPDNNLKRGSPVVAIGSPEGGEKNTVTTGVISSQRINDEGYPEIQISATITHGSSGGALFNDEGKVIGITSSGYDGIDINFAINIAVAQAMYNAWDGTRYTFSNFKDTAKMDFTGVYDHSSESVKQEPQNTEQPDNGAVINASAASNWTCPNCGSVNNSLFCQECGTEKPSWVCVCGNSNNGKFCGSCGKKAEDLVDAINMAIVDMAEHKYHETIDALEQLGEFDSGSFSTSKGAHIKAKDIIPEAYYEWGMYLVSVGGDHEEILACFSNAGSYGDAQKQINDENDRYYGNLCISASDKAEKGDYKEAIRLFELARDYVDAEEKIKETYYLWGSSLLNNKNYEGCREKFRKAGDYPEAATMILASFYLEGVEKFDSGEYEDAISKFALAGDYQDTKELISKTYYNMGLNAINNGQSDEAIELFTNAGDYEPAKEQIAKINENVNSSIYSEMSAAYSNGDYKKAKELAEKITGYLDADNIYKMSEYYDIKNEYKAFEEKKDINGLVNLIGRLIKLNDLPESNELQKEIRYILGVLLIEKGDLSSAISFFAGAGDYSDASEQLLAAKVQQYNSLVEKKNYSEAYDFYKNELLPLGYNQEYKMMKIDDKNDVVSYVLDLIRFMRLNNKIPKGENVYKQDYLQSVVDFENHFDLTVDGEISLSEYLRIKDFIFPDMPDEKMVIDDSKPAKTGGFFSTIIPAKTGGFFSTIIPSKNDGRTAKLLEKLSDLSYLGKLPEDHTKYEEKYINGVKKAEKALGVTVDGIITPEEYALIMDQDVQLDAPTDLKAKVDKKKVTISWKSVPGAISYNVYMGDSSNSYKIIAENVKTNKYTLTMSETGVTRFFKVEAVKYTTEKVSVPLSVEIPIVYVSVSISDLVEHFDDYKGQYVEIKNLTVDGWRTRYPSGNYGEFITPDCDLCILCKGSKGLVEVDFEDYDSWGWGENDIATLCVNDRLTSISGKGLVKDEKADWSEEKMEGLYLERFYVIYARKVPVISLHNGSYRYK